MLRAPPATAAGPQAGRKQRSQPVWSTRSRISSRTASDRASGPVTKQQLAPPSDRASGPVTKRHLAIHVKLLCSKEPSNFQCKIGLLIKQNQRTIANS
jgi:hypothetical protein